MVWLTTKMLLSGCTSRRSWTVKWLFLGPLFPLGIPSKLPPSRYISPKLFNMRLSTVSLSLLMLCIYDMQFSQAPFQTSFFFPVWSSETFCFKADIFLVMVEDTFEICFAVVSLNWIHFRVHWSGSSNKWVELLISSFLWASRTDDKCSVLLHTCHVFVF